MESLKIANLEQVKAHEVLMYYEMMHKMHIVIRLHRVAKVWLRHYIIDENNYAFLAGRQVNYAGAYD